MTAQWNAAPVATGPGHRGTGASFVARWNGSIWSAMGAGLSSPVQALAALPNGDVGAGGKFFASGGVSADYIARWNGTSWAPMGSGMGGGLTPYVDALMTRPNGDLVVGGSFFTAGGFASAHLATLITPCPATAVSLGGGCASSGGGNSLSATLPWTGSTWRVTGTGLPAAAFVMFVSGFTTISVPLPIILPQGVAGCSLLVSPDHLDVLLSNNGLAEAQFVLPNTPTLAGVFFFSQFVPLEFDPPLSIVAATSTNALFVTVGSF